VLPSQTVNVTIPRNWVDLYETIWKPEFFPKWASGLSQSSLVRESTHWKANGPNGVVKLRFTEHNPWGVMDHYVDSGFGKEVYVPMRVVGNEAGATVFITVFRQSLMSEDKFAQDIEWVKRDLQALHTLLTT
jgi:hypothetical protein